MPELMLDWSAAEYDTGVDGGSIRIPVADAPENEAWWAAFRETLAIHESENARPALARARRV